MSSLTNQSVSHGRTPWWRAVAGYAVVICVAFVLALRDGASRSDLVSGAIIFALGGVVAALLAWAITAARRSGRKQDGS